MNRLKIILSYIFGFLLSVGLFILSMLFIIKKTVTDRSFMFRLMDENNYYEKVYTSICEDIEDYMTSSGLEKEVLDGVISKNKVEKDIKEYTNGIYDNKKYEISTREIHDKLRNNIDHYLKDLNLGIDNTNELDLFISDIEGIYKEEVSFYNTLDSFSGSLARATDILSKVIIVDSVIVGVLFIILIVFRKINVGSCILSSGLILFLVKLFIYERIDSQNILVVSDHFSLIVRSIFKYINHYMIIISIILVIIGFIFSLIKISSKKD